MQNVKAHTRHNRQNVIPSGVPHGRYTMCACHWVQGITRYGGAKQDMASGWVAQAGPGSRKEGNKKKREGKVVAGRVIHNNNTWNNGHKGGRQA